MTAPARAKLACGHRVCTACAGSGKTVTQDQPVGICARCEGSNHEPRNFQVRRGVVIHLGTDQPPERAWVIYNRAGVPVGSHVDHEQALRVADAWARNVLAESVGHHV